MLLSKQLTKPLSVGSRLSSNAPAIVKQDPCALRQSSRRVNTALQAKKGKGPKDDDPQEASNNGQPEPPPTPPPSQPPSEGTPTVEPSAAVEPPTSSASASSAAPESPQQPAPGPQGPSPGQGAMNGGPQAAGEGEPKPEPAPQSSTAFSDFEPSLEDYKAALLDSFYGTERGLAARSEVRAEINELISQLEAKNPMPNPTEDLSQLDGTWQLAYTSNSELIAILALGRLPLVTVGDVVQRIDMNSGTVENKVGLTVPLQRTALSATSAFEVCSPKRLHLKLEQGKIQTPELVTDLELPDTLAVLGQSVDLSQLKQALSPVKQNLESLFQQINTAIAQGPELALPIRSERAQTWQLNTYLDENMRISRGDGGSIFVFCRAPGSSA